MRMKRTGRIVITLVTALLLVFTAACTPTPSSTPTWANTTPRTVTKVVAASNANTDWKAQADYVCDGVVEIQAAVDSLSAEDSIMLIGDFELSNRIIVRTDNITIEGNGTTFLHNSSSGGSGYSDLVWCF